MSRDLAIHTPVGDIIGDPLLTTIRVWEPCEFHIANPTVRQQICPCRVVYRTVKRGAPEELSTPRAPRPCQVTSDPGSEGVIIPGVAA